MTRLRPAAGLLLAGALATLLFAGALRAFFASIYFHNLTALGLNATALLALLLLAPLLYAFPRFPDKPRALALAAGALLVAGRVGMGLAREGVPHLAFAGLASAAFLVLLPALLRMARDASGEEGPAALAAGSALGWAADASLLVAFLHDATATPLGLLLVVPAGAGLLALLVASRPADAWPRGRDLPGRARLALAGLGVGAFLFLEHALLGAPTQLARWGPYPLWICALGVAGGLLAGAWMLARPPPRRALVLGALHALGLAGLLDHALLHSPAAPLLLAFAHAALVLDLALLFALLSLATLRGAGLALAWAGLAALLLHFALAFSFTFAYVPLGAFWKGQERVLGIVALALVALAAAVALGPWKARVPRPRLQPLLAALTALALAPLAALALPAAPVEVPTSDEPLRVLSFNLHQGFRNAGVLDPGLFVQVVREADADVVALQESDTVRFTSGHLDLVRILAQRLGYHAAYGPPTREQSVGVALLSRFPIHEADHHALPSASDNRFLLEARLDVHGRDLWVVATHFGLPSEDRLAQADALLARAERLTPRILAGDFNSCPEGRCPDSDDPDDDVYARLTRAHADGWAALGGYPGDPAAWTYDAARPFERIDYVFAGDGLRFTRYETLRTPAALAASDHLPVLAELDFPPS